MMMRKMVIIGENAIGGKRESVLFILVTYLISWGSRCVLLLLSLIRLC